MTTNSSITILTIEDELPVRESFAAYLEDSGYAVLQAENGQIGLDVFRQESPDLILVDLRMPEVDGLEVLATVTRESPDTPIIVVSGTGMISDAVEALHLGAWDYILKPVEDMDVLEHAVRRGLERSQLLKENKKHHEHLEELVKERTAELEKEIAERKQAEEALRVEKDKLEIVTRNIGVGLAIISRDFHTLWANDVLNEIFGDVEGKICYISYNKRTEICPDCGVREVFKTGKDRVVHEQTGVDADGNQVWSQIIATPIKDEEGIIKAALEVVVPITELKQAEEALRESEEKYRTVLEANPDPVVVYDTEGRVLYFNPAFTQVFGWTLDERFGKKMDVFVPGECWPETKVMIDKVLVGEDFSGIETLRFTKDGKSIHVSVSGAVYRGREGNPVGSVVNVRDISEQKKMELQLRQAQKMEAIGTLAGGIAHDFNNILGAIIGYTGMMEMFDVPEDSPMKAKLKEVLKAADRAKDLVQQILTFSRRTEEERKPIQLNYIVKEAIKFLRASLPTTIEIHPNIASKEIIALADPTQMHQVLMNLCTNAGHAMLETGGILTVELSSMDLDVQSAERFLDLKPGSFLKLTVGDTGCGMTSETTERIFDPFFTTKKAGEGTGMGLAVVHGIVTSHEGMITVDSKPGMGTTFQVILPRIEIGEIEPDTKTAVSLPAGRERILFVDDEHSLVIIAKQTLDRLGYEVTTKTSSTEALELFRSQPERFDLIITDQTMPFMTGMELAREVMQIRPGIPVILCTGHSEAATPERVQAAGIRELVVKPLELSDFAQAVRKVLDQEIDD